VPTFLGGNVVHLVTFRTPMIWNQKSMLGFRRAALAVSQSLDRVLYDLGKYMCFECNRLSVETVFVWLPIQSIRKLAIENRIVVL
jgi:hypothetical protein